MESWQSMGVKFQLCKMNNSEDMLYNIVRIDSSIALYT